MINSKLSYIYKVSIIQLKDNDSVYTTQIKTPVVILSFV